jgi:1-deoxy-D-xylulose-5-phosphate reductoisomerase
MAGVPEQAIILNAANEVAVAKFLNGDIGFCDIAGHVRATLEAGDYGIIADSFEAILALDREIRQR